MNAECLIFHVNLQAACVDFNGCLKKETTKIDKQRFYYFEFGMRSNWKPEKFCAAKKVMESRTEEKVGGIVLGRYEGSLLVAF